MFTRHLTFHFENSGLSKLSKFSLVLFFILLGDALLAFWIPNLLQEHLGSAFFMGLIISFSSMVGFAADLIFPQLLKNYTVKKLILSAIGVGVIFILSLALGIQFPYVLIFLMAMAIWGIYYEFLGFGIHQFVAETMTLKLRVEGWAIIDVFRSLAYFLGPIMAGWLLYRGEYPLLLTSFLFLILGYLIYLGISGRHNEKAAIEAKHDVNIMRELSHWKVLFPRIWPVLLLSLFIGLVDATFWTTGAVWSEKLAADNSLGLLLLPSYQLPFLIVPLVFTKITIFKGKKILSEKFLFASGVCLTLLYLNSGVAAYLLIAFCASLFLAAARPLVDAVYTDIISRMGIERKHLVGLSSSTISLSYVLGPIFAGLFSNFMGEKTAIASVGVVTVFVSIILLLFTPKKLRLPETEIKKWED